MAQPIPHSAPTYDPREELSARLDAAPAEHAEALLSAYDVLQGLHDNGVLELMRGMLGSSEKVLEVAVNVGKSPQSIRTMGNAISLINLIGQIPPKQLAGLSQAVPESLATVRDQQQPGPIKLVLSSLFNRDLWRGLWIGITLLTALGKHSKTHTDNQ